MKGVKQRTIRVLGWCLGLAMVLVTGWACSPLENEPGAPNKLVVDQIIAVDAQGNESTWLASDVVVIDQETGQATVFEDVAQAVLRNIWTNFSIEPTPLNDIILVRYRVTYTRPDGQNRVGIDVPFPFDGTMNAVVPVNGTTTVGFVVVRATAKLEEPLFRLRTGGGENVLLVHAQIDFYGHDLIGRNMTATGFLLIEFANWQDQ